MRRKRYSRRGFQYREEWWGRDLAKRIRKQKASFPFTVDEMIDKFKWFDRTFNPEPDTPEKAKREAEFEVFYRKRYAEEHPAH